mmetsp:Transcript_1842/g.6905  ORF Transcript_1842/g.6905 Transcript_1842/m.6905 type:complete len:161 (-) Transcript_1842:1090-1572(-)
MKILKMREKGMKLGFLVTSGGAWGGKGLDGNVQQRRLCWTSMAGKGFGMRPRFKYTGKLQPGELSPTRTVPKEILRPSYAGDGIPKEASPKAPWDIEVKSEADIEAMRVSGRLAREVGSPRRRIDHRCEIFVEFEMPLLFVLGAGHRRAHGKTRSFDGRN